MSKRFYALLLTIYVFEVLIFSLPPLRALNDPRYEGYPLFYGTDEAHYTVRVQEGLLGWGTDPRNGITSGVDAPSGLQPAGMEKIVGFLFSWTGWSGSTVILVVSILLAAFVTPLLILLLRELGIPLVPAFLGSITYTVLLFGPITRFVHQSWSLPLGILTLLCLVRWWNRPTFLRAVLAGALLGGLLHVYFWSWTFLWSVALICCLATAAVPSWRNRLRTIPLLILGVALLGVPYALVFFQQLADPNALEAATRTSLVYAHGLESFPRSIVVVSLAISTFFVFFKHRSLERHFPIVACSWAAAIVLHQQFVHGKILSFSTHYYPYICLAALLAIASIIDARPFRSSSFVALGAAFLLLFGAWKDYDHGARFFTLQSTLFRFQQLHEAIPVLRDGKKDTYMTDLETALAIASNTDDDVLFTEHQRVVLMSMKEYAERYCLSELFEPQGADPTMLAALLFERSSQGIEEEERRYKERIAIVQKACEEVSAHPQEALDRFHVTLLLWNEKDRPNWVIDQALFTKIRSGNGWSIWTRITQG